MTQPSHAPYTIEPVGADTVVLFIHGFMGSPDMFRPMARAAAARGFAVSAPLLPGHGGSARDFARSGAAAWRAAVTQEIRRLSALYPRLVLAGHSMGALLALSGGLGVPSVKGLILMATPMRLRPRLRSIRTSWRASRGILPPGDVYVRAASDCCSVRRSSLLAYVGVGPRCIDLLGMRARAIKALPRIRVPVLVLHGVDDELAAYAGVDILERGLTGCPVRKVSLAGSGHYYYPKADMKRMTDAMMAFLCALPAPGRSGPGRARSGVRAAAAALPGS